VGISIGNRRTVNAAIEHNSCIFRIPSTGINIREEIQKRSAEIGLILFWLDFSRPELL